jgi:hypothetical protein
MPFAATQHATELEAAALDGAGKTTCERSRSDARTSLVSSHLQLNFEKLGTSLSKALLAGNGSSACGRCLSEDQVLAFSNGELSPAQQADLDLHVDTCSACRELVLGVAANSASPHADLTSEARLSLFPGQVIAGRYRIEHFIARGGMGEIYRAHELTTGKPRALKTLLRTKPDVDAAQLAREATLGKRISHDHVCRFHEHGTELGSRSVPLPFLTMELIEGPRLGQLLRRGALPLQETLRIARQVLSGLAAIHAAAVLHLDFKSDNIVLRGPQGPHEAVIIDFGLSRCANKRAANDPLQPLIGTFSYMAPEQALAVRPSTHSDVFSFGVVLFEMLTRRLPFEAPGESPTANIVRRLVEPAPRPSDFARDIPAPLDEFVLRCLAGKRQERFVDAGEALRGLDEMVEQMAETA